LTAKAPSCGCPCLSISIRFAAKGFRRPQIQLNAKVDSKGRRRDEGAWLTVLGLNSPERLPLLGFAAIPNRSLRPDEGDVILKPVVDGKAAPDLP
jgi:hypothetical protein